MELSRGVVRGLAAMLGTGMVAVLLSCSGSGGGVDQDDDTVPGAVTDLAVRNVTATTVTLAWTAPGDDAMTGTADTYDIRYSKAEITWQNWSAATPVSGEPAPHTAGSLDTMVVTGFQPDSAYYFALMTQNHQGVWSYLSNCVGTVCFDNFVVTFGDPALEAVVRAEIPKSTGDIRRLDLMGVRFLDAQNRGITTLEGLQYCLNLETLFITHNAVSDLSPLAPLKKLISLQAGGNDITDIGPLAGLVHADQLILRDNDIGDISAMAGMTELGDVHLGGNHVSDIGALAGKTKMRMLMLGQNEIVDVTPLAGMTQLRNLDLAENQIASLAPLAGLTALEWLNLYDNQVADVSPLTALVNVTFLSLWSNEVSDIAALVANAGLDSGDILYLTGNPLSAESVNVHVPALVARGVVVNL